MHIPFYTGGDLAKITWPCCRFVRRYTTAWLGWYAVDLQLRLEMWRSFVPIWILWHWSAYTARPAGRHVPIWRGMNYSVGFCES